MKKRIFALALALCMICCTFAALALNSNAATVDYNTNILVLSDEVYYGSSDASITIPNSYTVSCVQNGVETVITPQNTGYFITRAYGGGYKPLQFGTNQQVVTLHRGDIIKIYPYVNINEENWGYSQFITTYPNSIELQTLSVSIDPTASDVLSESGNVTNGFLGFMGNITTQIITNPILMIFLVGLPITGAALFWARYMLRRGRRKK